MTVTADPSVLFFWRAVATTIGSGDRDDCSEDKHVQIHGKEQGRKGMIEREREV